MQSWKMIMLTTERECFLALPSFPKDGRGEIVYVYECKLTKSRIYGELAEQYKILDAAGATNKRGILAKHLKEVIDTLEQKVSLVFLAPN